jgi:iron complex outermembrane recepter protein
MGEVGNFLNWTIGGFYFEADGTITSRINIGYNGLDFINGPDEIPSTTYAVFANAIANVTDRLTLVAGARYTRDKKGYFFRRTAPDGGVIPALNAINNVRAPDFIDSRIDYRVALSYEVARNTIAYGSISSGFKGGGVNPRPFFPVQAASFDPETLITYEIGLKSDLLDNTLRFNISAFYNDYSDVQLTFNNCSAQFPGFGAPCSLPANAGDATVKGVELEMVFAPTPELRIDGSFSYLDFQFQTLRPFTGVALTARPPYTPETTWSIGGEYSINTALGTFKPRVDLSYQGSMFTAPDNSALGQIDAVTLLNASVRFTPQAHPEWSITIEGRNLTDALYYQERRDVRAGTGTAYGSPALPRTFNATLKYQF